MSFEKPRGEGATDDSSGCAHGSSLSAQTQRVSAPLKRRPTLRTTMLRRANIVAALHAQTAWPMNTASTWAKSKKRESEARPSGSGCSDSRPSGSGPSEPRVPARRERVLGHPARHANDAYANHGNTHRFTNPPLCLRRNGFVRPMSFCAVGDPWSVVRGP